MSGKGGRPVPGVAEKAREEFAADPLAKRETLELVRAYYRIRDPNVRKRLFDLAKSRQPADRERLLLAIADLCDSPHAGPAMKSPAIQALLSSIFMSLVVEAERDIRLTREAVEKVQGWEGLPLDAEKFALILKDARERLPEETYAEIEKAFDAADEAARADPAGATVFTARHHGDGA